MASARCSHAILRISALSAGAGMVLSYGDNKDWNRVCQRAKQTGLPVHDFRHVLASFAITDGALLYIVGKALGHTQARTTDRYARSVQNAASTAAAWIAARVLRSEERRVGKEG